MSAIQAAVFDAYGTLFDVAGAARQAAAEPRGAALADVWPKLASDWRAKQLSYTWLRSLMGLHADFAAVTADALDWAMEAAGISDPAIRARLLALYDELPCHREAPAALARLRDRGLPRAILSNGTHAMLASACRAAGLADLVDPILSIEDAGVYKPHPAVYRLANERLGLPAERILFVSANGWDAAGAAAFGFRTAWINRLGEPADHLPGSPDHVLPDLSSVPDLVR